ncbi:tyrosine-type recombinase/integrase [Streptomyces atratus]|uniref:tyrosine-type recombinase/integrase n=1 Tax=Streptomyces atratus TaxID=1893 RepID=UPI002256755E|nr:tyrosine-type recombinase/integrase [Streptomyces atratus]MCX5345973.1 site-specific integrase [Streptomyces atratus]
MQHLRLPASRKWSATTRLLNRHTGHPHTASAGTRHTHATRMREGGMRELTLQKRLGHASPESTRIYTRVSDPAVVAECNRALGGHNSATGEVK